MDHVDPGGREKHGGAGVKAGALRMDRMFTLIEIASATGGRLLRGEPSTVVSGVSIDSRTIRPGELFVAIKGDRFDGHEYIYDALRRGACGAVVDVARYRMPDTAAEEALLRGRILVGVTDTISGLQGLARFHRERWGGSMTAVTGSNGKTTTKEMAASILSRRYSLLRTEGNLNNHIGVPLTLLRLAPGHQAALIEMGISRAGELRRLAETARPQVGLITNIGATHLEMLGTVEGVAEAKAELMDALPADGMAILNRDDPFYGFLRARSKGTTATFGAGPDSDVRLTAVQEGEAGLTADLVLRPDLFGAGRPRMRIDRAVDSPVSIRAGLSVFGRHNAINAAAAAAVGWVMGCDAETIRQGLEAFRPVAMRSEMIPWEERMILNDAYNANPASMRAALDTLSRLPGGRRVAVLGDMRELGESEAQAHREVGEAAAACGIAYLIAMGSNAGRIAEGAVAGRMSPDRVAVCRDPEEAAKALRRETGPGDVILLKGSRGMKMERILEALGVRRGEGH